MTYLTTAGLLNDLQNSITDASAAGRVRLLSFLNAAMYSLLFEPREWMFLKRKVTLSIRSDAIYLPFDFGMLDHFTLGAEYYLDQSNELTPQEAFSIASVNSGHVFGFTLDNQKITIVPSAGTYLTASVSYVATMNEDYTDSTEDTLFPSLMSNCLQRMTLTQWYEYEQDERMAGSAALEAQELRKVKAWDNRSVPVPKITAEGYRR